MHISQLHLKFLQYFYNYDEELFLQYIYNIKLIDNKSYNEFILTMNSFPQETDLNRIFNRLLYLTYFNQS
jgi:hypothetical protein